MIPKLVGWVSHPFQGLCRRQADHSFPRSSVGMQSSTLRVVFGSPQLRTRERPGRHSHAEHGNELTDSPEIVYGDCHTTLKEAAVPTLHCYS